MGIYVDDGHGLWTLQAFADFNIDGTIKRGFYFKKTSEQAGPMTAELTGSNLLLLEHAEMVNRQRLNDPLTRQDVLDKLRDPNYRGALIYATVDDAKTNFGELYTRMNNAKREWGETAQAAGLPVPEYHPGPIMAGSGSGSEVAPTEEFDPADTNKDHVLSNRERKEWNKAHPDDQK